MPHILAALPEPSAKPARAPKPAASTSTGDVHAAGADADDLVTIPLPSSALMGLALIGGVVVFARFPSSARKRRRRLGA